MVVDPVITSCQHRAKTATERIGNTGRDVAAQAVIFLEQPGPFKQMARLDAVRSAREKRLPIGIEIFQQGAGFGIRWRSPIGPVRADIACGLSDPRHPIVFHLNIGPDL